MTSTRLINWLILIDSIDWMIDWSSSPTSIARNSFDCMINTGCDWFRSLSYWQMNYRDGSSISDWGHKLFVFLNLPYRSLSIFSHFCNPFFFIPYFPVYSPLSVLPYSLVLSLYPLRDPPNLARWSEETLWASQQVRVEPGRQMVFGAFCVKNHCPVIALFTLICTGLDGVRRFHPSCKPGAELTFVKKIK